MQKVLLLIDKIMAFLIENIRTSGDGSTLDLKLIAIGKIGFIASIVPTIHSVFTGWYMENSSFIYFVFIAISIDHILGSYVHWRFKRDFNWKKNRDGLFIKVAGSVLGYVLLEMLHQIAKDAEIVVIYLRITMQLVVFLYPAFSALKNLNILTSGKFPPKFIFTGIDGFNKTGDLNNFKTTKNNENTETDLSDNLEGVIDNNDNVNDNGLPK